MAKTAVNQWDTTAANNTDVGGISIAEGMAPSDVNNAMREMMAQLKASPAGLLAQTAASDSTSNRLLKVGAFGIGGALVSSEADLNNYTLGGTYITPATGLTNLPSGWSQTRYVVAVDGGTSHIAQVITNPATGAQMRRTFTAAWGTWGPIGDLLAANNLSEVNAASARSNIGANNAANLTTGTLPDDRVSATLTADKAFRRGNILASVSQSGGVPTGGLIERGSNANGEYAKFADGTMICRNPSFAYGDRISVLGAIYSSGSLIWSYPAAFAQTPTFGGFPISGATAVWGFLALGTAASTSVSEAVFRVAGATSVSGSGVLSLIATGRWF